MKRTCRFDVYDFVCICMCCCSTDRDDNNERDDDDERRWTFFFGLIHIHLNGIRELPPHTTWYYFDDDECTYTHSTSKKKNPFLSNETLQHWNQRYHFCFVSMDASFDLSDVPTSHLIREMQRRLRCEQVPDTRTILIGKSNSTEKKKKTLRVARKRNQIIRSTG